MSAIVKVATLFGTHSLTFLKALGTTLEISLISLVIALILGIVFALFKLIGPKPLKWIANIYISAIRGTPLLVQILFIYFGIPMVTHMRWNIIVAGIVVMSVNAGAYLAEVIRGGIESVDHGQVEAARSLGMSYAQTMRKIVLPQALRTMLPSLVNQFIVTIKDTSLLSVIGLRELTQNTKIIVANNMEALAMYFICGVWYWVIITLLSLASSRLEKKTKYGKEA